jgi:5-methylcytosine-specific restriction protein B
MASKLNKILYGPPGTGKTFHSISYAVAIAEGKSDSEIECLMKYYIDKCRTEEGRMNVKQKYDLYSAKNGVIKFCTFHQSIGYEDFVEGIKPILNVGNLLYKLNDGVFKKICITALNFDSMIVRDETNHCKKMIDLDGGPKDIDTIYNENEELNDELIDDDNMDGNYEDYLNWINKRNARQGNQFPLMSSADYLNYTELYNKYINYIFNNGKINGINKVGAPIEIYNTNIHGMDFFPTLITKGTLKVNKFSNSNPPQAIQAERSISKIHIIQTLNVIKLGRKPNRKNANNGDGTVCNHICEDIIDIFSNEYLQLRIDANDVTENENSDYIPESPHIKGNEINNDVDEIQNYVLIIDEINRGNVSHIFGELITLIEDSKRIGASEQIKVILPYSEQEFGVPSNIYIIGTMNTADRSVEALDTALRRRFDFIPMPPDPSLLSGIRLIDAPLIDLKKVLECINQRIEALIDSDHTIGHSFFINVKNKAELINTFKNNIIPLLQEYFYGNAERIGWVLGEGFVNAAGDSYNGGFAQFGNIDQDLAKPSISIKNLDHNFPIEEAIRLLINAKQQ